MADQPPGRRAGRRPLERAGREDLAGALLAARGWERGADRAAGARPAFERGALLVAGVRDGAALGADLVVGAWRGAARCAGRDDLDGAARLPPRFGIERADGALAGAERADGARCGVARLLGVRLGALRVDGVVCGAIRSRAPRLGVVTRVRLPLRLGVALVEPRLVPLRLGVALVVSRVRLGRAEVGAVRPDVVPRAASPDRGMRLGSAAEGRLAWPPRVLRPTDSGTRPTVGVRAVLSPPVVRAGRSARWPSEGRAVLVDVPEVGPTRGARRLTLVEAAGRALRASATVALGAALVAVGRRCAVRPDVPRGLSLYVAPPPR